MKFSWKVFISTITLVTLAFGIGGTLMISFLFQQSLAQERKMALQENRYLCFTFQNAIQSLDSYETFDPDDVIVLMDDISDTRGSDFSITTAVKGVRFDPDGKFAGKVEPGERVSRIVTDDNRIHYIQIVSHTVLSDADYYLESVKNISSVYEMRDRYISLYQWILLTVTGISSLVLLVLTHFLTLPLKRLTNITQKIASGSFSTRAINKGSDEIGILTRNFNIMADVVEEKIHDLEETARQREDFVASFAHELKTPLTSIIGYADMLRSYDMDAQERLMAANYIFSEGKRLESLSLHLLDLIVLHKNEFSLLPTECVAFLHDVENILRPLLQKYQVTLKIENDDGCFLAEPALIKTLLYNLIDNACKASKEGGIILLSCRKTDGEFCFSVQDWGRGIPQEELSKITEPFYMVDKSRARKQNGAGLGLALCQEIAQIHGSSLTIKSRFGEGTCVSFLVKEAPVNEN